MRPISGILLALLLPGFAFVPAANAEVYIYRGPDGERMISDHPLPAGDKDYQLLTRRDTLQDAGHILAKRRVVTGSAREYRFYIDSASERYRIDPALVEAVIEVESGFNPEAVSNRGATGLMQLMRSTAQRYEVNDRFNPRENINAGVRHLSYLMERFDGQVPLALAAYNAGAGSVERYRGIPPFPETRRFVDKVLNYHMYLKRLYAVQ
jgi:soluble lytic murein transglycosylase-like protein